MRPVMKHAPERKRRKPQKNHQTIFGKKKWDEKAKLNRQNRITDIESENHKLSNKLLNGRIEK